MNSQWPARPSVAFLGPEGTYTHSAVQSFFNESTPEACVAIEDIFARVDEGLTDFGVAPVENSTEGTIVQTLDCLNGSEARICGEVLLRIHHAFLAIDSPQAGPITRIWSHQQSLGQCRHWLKENYPDAELRAVSSNSEAARLASENPGTAAIAGVATAPIYGLQVLAESIEDSHDNTTRFIVISKKYEAEDSGNDKTSIMLSAHDEPGTLFHALEPFHRFGISLTKLESRPSRRAAWSYTFYLDLLGNRKDERVRAALSELHNLSLEVTILGSYPRATMGTDNV